MNWINIETKDQIESIANEDSYSIIYKHSPRCVVSMMAHRRLKSELPSLADQNIPLYIVDVVKNRAESMAIADHFGVVHESPQLLLVQKGKVIYDASHEDVTFNTVLEKIGSN
ncbi:bacillithiol system redox-active protein YtxJ [Dyadobacter tibetensis]|uniref:bacillithiol system redox-active protein YtxJ n=1 Tax=Dyadobacter tibetensis TaxID=1211851 RepID=UPI0004700EAE|nr:bacillithiol system redox-active protein YtxJ [Dyadobacter tibetensis]